MGERFMQISGTVDYHAAFIAAGASEEQATRQAAQLIKRDELFQDFIDKAVESADEMIAPVMETMTAGFGFDERDPDIISTRNEMRMIAVRNVLTHVGYVVGTEGALAPDEAGAKAYLASCA